MTQMAEQETTITFGRTEEVVRIYTSVPAHIRRLDKDPRATRTQVWYDEKGRPEAASFEVAASDWRPIAFKTRRREMTEEEREAARLRLAASRVQKNQTQSQGDSAE